MGKRRVLAFIVFLTLSLAGCMPFFQSTETNPKESTAHKLSSLASTGKEELLQRALASESVQKIVAQLERRGWTRQEGAEEAIRFERGQEITMVFNKKEPQFNRKEPQFPREGRTPSPRAMGSPKGAFLIHCSLPEGEEVFAVFEDELDPRKLIHFYPDGERIFLRFDDGNQLLSQLRRNERFVKFEAWLKAHVEQISCGPALVDKTTNTAYILLRGLVSRVFVQAMAEVGPRVYPPPSSYQEKEAYLVLAKVVSVANQSVTIDSQSIWVLPHSPLENLREAFATRALKVGEVGPYQLLAGGRRPSAWPDLRSFGWPRPVDLYDAEIMRAKTLPGEEEAGPLPPKKSFLGLTAFLWGLADYPAENLVFKFKTDAEPTLEAHNLAVRYGLPVALGAHSGRRKPTMAFVGFGPLTLTDVNHFYYNPEDRMIPLDKGYLIFSARGLKRLLEAVTGVPMEDIGHALYELALAIDAGRFEEAYEELRPRGLSALETLFDKVTAGLYREHYKPLIRNLALAWRKHVAQKLPSLRTQALEPSSFIKELFVEFVKYVVDALISAYRGEPALFERVTVFGKDGELKMYTRDALRTISLFDRDYIVSLIDEHSQLPPVPKDLPIPGPIATWRPWIYYMLAQAVANPQKYTPFVGWFVLWRTYSDLAYYHRRQVYDLPYLLELSVTMYRAHAQYELSTIAAGVDTDMKALVLYRRDYKRKVEGTSLSVPCRDLALVKYAEEPDKKRLDWASRIIDELEKTVDRAPKMYGVAGSAEFYWSIDYHPYGVDVVALVITQDLNINQVQEFLKAIKDHPLYEKSQAPRTRKKPSEVYGAIDKTAFSKSVAFVAVWKNKCTNTLEYVWIDYEDKTPKDVRDQVVKAISGVPVDVNVQVQEVDLSTSLQKFSAESTIALRGGGGGWERLDSHHLLLSLPIH